MSFYSLPQNSNTVHPYDIRVSESHDNDLECESFISVTSSKHIAELKTMIEDYLEEWEYMKKFVNPYEFIHTTIPGNKVSVGKHKPISRSYFKFVEIYHMLRLDATIERIKTFHLAEGPGGFIEAIVKLRANQHDTYVGMTLEREENRQVPGWSRFSDTLTNTAKNVILERGQTKDGDILEASNLKYCFDKYGSQMDLITADGGFDFSVDFNKQELMSSKLIFAEMCYAILLQKEGGTFILKIFDCFSKATSEMLYMLSCFYKRVYVVKPNTSRYANSERYLVCKSFRGCQVNNYADVLCKSLEKVKKGVYINRIFHDFEMPYIFLNKLEEINAVFVQQQLEAIAATLSLIHHKNRTSKLEQLKHAHVTKCVNWCIRFKEPFNRFSQNNSFAYS